MCLEEIIMKMFMLYSLLRNVAVDLKPRNFPQAVRAACSLVNEECHQVFRTVWIWMFALGRFDFYLDELEVVVFVQEALARRNDWDWSQHVGTNLKNRRRWNETDWSKALPFIPACLPACLPGCLAASAQTNSMCGFSMTCIHELYLWQ